MLLVSVIELFWNPSTCSSNERSYDMDKLSSKTCDEAGG